MKQLWIVACIALFSLTLAAPAGAQSTEAQASLAESLVPVPISQVEISDQGSCYVENDCDSCPTVSCEDPDGDCHSGQDWVECGGDRTYCDTNCNGDCTATADCLDGSYATCTGSNYSCFDVAGCYASCDGVKYWCANPQEPCLEIN